jgi:elongation factor P hydroxylase
LHEVAHWCLAGDERRKMIDYGYWYNSDGRSNIAQKKFEEVEVKPQALEWIFSIASNNTFHVSIDNLDGDQESSWYFSRSISDQAHTWCVESLPNRALLFVNALVCYTGINPFDSSLYQFCSE